MRPLFIDGFAGGGGASTGIAQAIGRDVDIAINHSPSAIAIHKANHPGTEHFCQDIRAIWPTAATRLRPVAGAWFSPDCKEYSKAKGGPVKDRHIRALANEVTVWLRETLPDYAYLENVEEFEYAAPLDESGIPVKGLEGKAFKSLVRQWRGLGYRVQHRKLKACDYGTPTSRRRLYVIMNRLGRPIIWPKPTHAPANDNRVLAGKLLPYRTAAECIDWSIPCPSIFERQRELVDATKRRIAHGVMRFVVNAAHPFIVGTAFTNTRASRVFDPEDPLRTATTQAEYGVVDAEIAPFVSYGQHGGANRPADHPLHTVAASKKDTNGVVAAHLHKMAQNGVGKDAREPLDTAMAGATKHGLVTAHLEKFNADSRPRPATAPLDTVMASSAQHAVVETSVVPAAFIDRQFGNSAGNAATEPLGATTAGGGGKSAAVTAFLSSFYTSNTNGGRGDPRKPLKTACAAGQHHAIVAAHIEQANTGMIGHPAPKPLSTIVGKGCTQRIVETTLVEEGALPPELMERAVRVAAFLVKYYATDGENEAAQSQAADRPLDVVTAKARFAVVTVTIDAVTYVIVDIGLRMLKPRELARAQGFPENYILNPIVRKFIRGKWVERPLTIAEQISAIGNSVCPPVARALVAANQPELIEQEERLAA